MENVKRFFGACALVAVAALQFGCGEGGTNKPSVQLTASAVASDAGDHAHVVSIPFADISATPASDVYQYRTAVTNGHSHVIALSKQQMIDLNNGMRLELTSSAPDSGTAHTHSWSVQGGRVLYDKNCYNCHSDSKRGDNPMNASFNSSQTAAVKNPGGAPLSTATKAVPDPAFSPAAAVTPTPVVKPTPVVTPIPGATPDGAALYATHCASCHNPLATSGKLNTTAAKIKAAITGNVGNMGSASLRALTDVEIQAIATALVN